jgi:hypothetical protein
MHRVKHNIQVYSFCYLVSSQTYDLNIIWTNKLSNEQNVI